MTPRQPKPRSPAGGSPRAGARREGDSARVAAIVRGLEALYPTAHCELDFANPFQLLVATILSAQSTDKTVNTVTPALFARFPDAAALAAADPATVEELIKRSGFFRQKTRSIVGAAKLITERHGGEVPRTMEALTALPGVARKTANVVLGTAFAMNEGFVVDTHVQRLAGRLGLSQQQEPVKIERELMARLPRDKWTQLGHQLIWHGRRICGARKPACGACALAPLCPTAPTVRS